MKATRPLEFVSVFQVEMPTDEGNAYVYCALDSHSEFLFQTGIERNRNYETIIKHVNLLMEHPKFKEALERHKSFKLVFHKFTEITPKINAIIEPLGGKMIVNDAFVAKEFAPVIKHLYSSMGAKKK